MTRGGGGGWSPAARTARVRRRAFFGLSVGAGSGAASQENQSEGAQHDAFAAASARAASLRALRRAARLASRVASTSASARRSHCRPSQAWNRASVGRKTLKVAPSSPSSCLVASSWVRNSRRPWASRPGSAGLKLIPIKTSPASRPPKRWSSTRMATKRPSTCCAGGWLSKPHCTRSCAAPRHHTARAAAGTASAPVVRQSVSGDAPTAEARTSPSATPARRAAAEHAATATPSPDSSDAANRSAPLSKPGTTLTV
mmetsp:Transcript_12027/g.41559  ORF Transcript_12027/g.41559 Transcript_12027/m.41559 type:complete len:257 (-) Transcript_12027:89-859(-)